MKRDIGIVHYNTPELTGALIKSVRKQTPGCSITILDNSDRRPLEPVDGVTILDNTRGQLIDFDALIARYPGQLKTCNRQGSAKHIASVDYLFDILPDGFVLMDGDILLKRDISDFWDRSYAWVGSAEQQTIPDLIARLAPYLLWINVPMLRDHGIRFWHEGRAYKLSHEGPPFYDTGASLYHDCIEAKLVGRFVDIKQYALHFIAGSYQGTEEAMQFWLERNKHLYL